MVDSPTAGVQVPQDKPPGWVNSWMRWALTTPGIQKMVGQGVALLSFQGAKTGKPYTIPVSYHREGDVVTITTKRQRKWWHNFETPAPVELRLAGRMYRGTAGIVPDDAAALEFMTGYLQKRPVDARAYGLSKEELTRERIAGIVPHIVLIRVAITPTE